MSKQAYISMLDLGQTGEEILRILETIAPDEVEQSQNQPTLEEIKF